MKSRSPRHGSLQFWPRVRAKRETARVRSWTDSKDAQLLGFPAYKVGMTHVVTKPEPQKGKRDAFTNTSRTHAVTVLECPAIKVLGIRLYKKDAYGTKVVAEAYAPKLDKEMSRTLDLAKKSYPSIDKVSAEGADYARIVVHTQPARTSIGKKKPEVLEIGIGGSVADQIEYAKANLGNEVNVADVFNAGEFVDTHAITTGRGFQGPVKRFGINLKAKKSEKGQRAPGSLGGWISQAHTMWRIAHAGQMGYHTRTAYNKQVFKIGDNVEEVNAKGGFLRYGQLKNNYILIKGSVQGPSKRLVTITKAIRANPKKKTQAPEITHISTDSKQGVRI